MGLDVEQLPLGAFQSNCYVARHAGADQAVVLDPRRHRRAPPLARARGAPERRRGARAGRNPLPDTSRPGPYGRARGVRRGGFPLLGRRPLRRLRRANGSPRRELGCAPRLDPRAGRVPSAGDGRLSRARTGDDARRRAPDEPVPRRPPLRGPVKIEAPRGTLDVLPADQPRREAVLAAADETAALAGYGRIVTPTFEDTELFARTSGAGSDVVHKEMYTFEDRAGRSLTLRPEGTAPVARAYIEHGLHREPQPVKTYYIGPMYRYSAPQKGRYREFW